MKVIRILRGTVADGKMVDAGQIVEVQDDTAKLLIGMRKAEAAEAPTTDETAVIQAPERAVTRGKRKGS